MFDLKYLVLVAAAVAVLPRGGARSLVLSEMINKTVCAIDVRLDVNEDRIPQRIKVISCATQTDQGCVANSISDRHCCHFQNKMECVEMRDTMLVYNKKLKKPETIQVAVGCACMIQTPSSAVDPREPHGR